jgi:hypothetical protein
MSHLDYIWMYRDPSYLRIFTGGHDENPGNLLRSACRILHPDIVHGDPYPSGITKSCAFSIQPDSRICPSQTEFFQDWGAA